MQAHVIEKIINISINRGLSSRQTAYVLAITRAESGFNPDAAAGPSSAYGLGQFINKTGGKYGIHTKSDRLNVDKQINALISHYLDNEKIAKRRGLGEEYIYKYHHDGPVKDSGGLSLSRQKVMPFINQYQHIVDKYIQQHKDIQHDHEVKQQHSIDHHSLPHAVHKLHNECREKLQAFCHKHGIKSDSPTDIDNVSMALAAEAYKNRMTGVSHLNLDIKENKVAAMNYEPDLRTAALNLAQAAITSVSESIDKIKHISEQLLNHQQQQT